MTILLVEQYVEFALRLAERYAVMDAGRIEHSGDVATADAAMFASLVVDLIARRKRAMRLSQHEQERLLVHVAADVARARQARGLQLNHPEAWPSSPTGCSRRPATAASVADLMQAGRHVLRRDDVMEGIPEMIDEVQVEATFPDGTKLVTLHQPIT